MIELIDEYSLEGEFVEVKSKKDSHSEMKEEFLITGKTSRKHKHAKGILLTSEGKVILQKRSKWKGDNPGLWDKTVGGHLFKNESFDFCMIRECAEELQIPLTVVNNSELKYYVSGLVDLKVLGLMFEVETIENSISNRVHSDGSNWKEQSITAFYIGYYDGYIRFERGESSGFRVSSYEELTTEIESEPEAFTDDIKEMLEKWKHLIKPLSEVS